jgi:arylsulfate sulfotransferase
MRIITLAVLASVLMFGCKKDDLNVISVVPPVVAVDFVIPADSIKLDTYGYTPLSALINFSSPLAGKTVIIVKGKHGEKTDIKHAFNDTGLSHSVIVIGLYASYLNTVYIRSVNNNGDTVARATVNIQTGDLPAGLPVNIENDIIPNENVAPGLNLASSFSTSNPRIPYMVDTYGDIRWVLNYRTHPTLATLSYDNGIRRLRNGNFYFGDKVTDQIYEIDLLGQILNSWDLSATGYIFHHDINEKPDGNFILSVSKTNSTRNDGMTTIEDYIIEVNRRTGSIQTVWDLKESLDEDRMVLFNDLRDWIHVNSVLYDSTDNTIIISGRHQGVTKLDFQNRVKWIISPHRGWNTNRRGENLNNFLLTPLDAGGTPITDTAVQQGSINHPDFEWCWYQHSTIAIPNGDFMVFDNGATRNFDDAGPKYSRAVEYKIDTVNKTIQQKWQYGKERGLETSRQSYQTFSFTCFKSCFVCTWLSGTEL